MSKKSDYIVVFDSGVGGISVLRQLRRAMPQERYLYFGDSANAPYGTRTEEAVRNLTLAAAEKLMARGVKAFVIACNTATSAAYEALVEKYPDKIIVGIEPPLAQAAKKYPGGHIGVLATPGTLAGNRFLASKARFSKECQVTPLPAPGLMELVEAGKQDTPEADALLHSFLDPYQGKLDALLLGCTHHSFAGNAIQRVLGDKVDLLDGAEITTELARTLLAEKDLLHDGEGELVIENSMEGQQILTLSKQMAEMA